MSQLSEYYFGAKTSAFRIQFFKCEISPWIQWLYIVSIMLQIKQGLEESGEKWNPGIPISQGRCWRNVRSASFKLSGLPRFLRAKLILVSMKKTLPQNYKYFCFFDEVWVVTARSSNQMISSRTYLKLFPSSSQPDILQAGKMRGSSQHHLGLG